jgi:hypothetical protein
MTDRIPPTQPPPSATAETQPSMTALVSGIVNDLQQLIRHELQLARTEVKQEWDKAKSAAAAMAAGVGLLLLGVFMLCFFVVHLIVISNIPLWGSFGIVGGILAVLGLLLLGMGYARSSRVHVVPPQTAQTLKENVQWIQNPK